MEQLAAPADLQGIGSQTASNSKEQQPTEQSSSTSNGKNSSKSLTNTQGTAMKTMAQKLEENAPYNLFFTTIPELPQTLLQKNAVTFTDLLCPSLGELKCSLQMNFQVDSAWLMEQYEKMGQEKIPLTILYGEFHGREDLDYEPLNLPNVIEHLVHVAFDPYGIHHSKVGIYAYSDNSLRVVVSTANLRSSDWNIYNNGLWVSPRCPVLPSGSPDRAGDSSTNFKVALLSYLQDYKLPFLKQWIDFVKRADFSDVKVFLIVSTPGCHTAMARPSHSHLHSMGGLLSTHCSLPTTTRADEESLSWSIVVQSSSLGMMGKAQWLRSTLLRALASHQNCRLPVKSNATISIVYPTNDNVLDGYFGLEGCGCLAYNEDIHKKQEWVTSYMHHWKADKTNRSRTMPHIKTYCRVSPCMTQLAWFLLSSANISISAWGSYDKKSGISYNRSYEVGVLFMPKYFDETYFRIKATSSGENTPLFPFIYDLPLTPYKHGEEPWCT